MKRMISASHGSGPDVEYNVTINFCGFIGRDEELVIDARAGIDADELLYIIQEDYADELLDGEVIDVDEEDDMYEVEVTFAGQIGTSEIYSVWADDEDEAIDLAIEEAKDDIDIVEFHEL